MRNYFRENKACLPAVVVIAVLLVSLICLFGIRTPGYAVYINGNMEFTLKHKADLQKALNKIEAKEEQRCQKGWNYPAGWNAREVW
jgi:hypothetical protein